MAWLGSTLTNLGGFFHTVREDHKGYGDWAGCTLRNTHAIRTVSNRQTKRVMWSGWVPLLQILVVSSTLSEKTIKVMGSGQAALSEIHTPSALSVIGRQ